MLPRNFSILSAQCSATHDERSHQALRDDLVKANLAPVEVAGYYGGHEQSWLVAHDGSSEAVATIDYLGARYGQESVIHSLDSVNELRFMDGRPSLTGSGYQVNGEWDDYYSVLDGNKFRLNVG